MPRTKSTVLTPVESEIMSVLWTGATGVTFTVESVVKKLKKKRHYNTVLTLLRIMERKKYVGHAKHGRGYVYFSLISKNQAVEAVVNDVAARFFSGDLGEFRRFLNRRKAA